MEHRILLLIPARFQSSRFPGKPLAKISGKTLIQRVYENCNLLGTSAATLEIETCVVTDSDEIESHLNQINARCVRVDDDVASGSDRIYLAYERFFSDQKWDLVINVQGDEPLINKEILKDLAQFHLKNSFDIATLVNERNDIKEFKNPNMVKTIFCENSGRCLYFSRKDVPYYKEGEKNIKWFHHLGVYSYTPKALESFAKYSLGQYEGIEKLEQLKALENGLTIGAVKTESKFIGVDTPEDIAKVEGALA